MTYWTLFVVGAVWLLKVNDLDLIRRNSDEILQRLLLALLGAVGVLERVDGRHDLVLVGTTGG